MNREPSEPYLFRLIIYTVAGFGIIIVIYAFLTYIPLQRTTRVVTNTGTNVNLALQSVCGVITQGSIVITTPKRIADSVAPRTVALCQQLLRESAGS